MGKGPFGAAKRIFGDGRAAVKASKAVMDYVKAHGKGEK